MSDSPQIRVLLLGPLYSSATNIETIGAYLNPRSRVLVNTYYWQPPERDEAARLFQNTAGVAFESFDPSDVMALAGVITRGSLGFDVFVCPTHIGFLTPEILQIATQENLHHKLRAIGCPNDALTHLAPVYNAATAGGIALIHTPHVHAEAVAEYTLGQIYFHARRLGHFYTETGHNGTWPHAEAIDTTRTVAGRTIGILGGSGKDGSAIAAFAVRLGLKVVALGAGSPASAARLRAIGAEPATDLASLLKCSDFISVNCRTKAETIGLIGTAEIGLMKKGVIIINPAGAEIIDGNSLLAEFDKPWSARRIGTLVLDMPYGGRRDESAFRAHALNGELKERGVLFTPRMAGYTTETEILATKDLAAYLQRYLWNGEQDIPIANRSQGNLDEPMRGLREVIVRLTRVAAEKAVSLRGAGLEVAYNSDGSPTSNADVAAEDIIKNGLRDAGYVFQFRGEESSEDCVEADSLEIIVDGIDGTRNFRDCNFGWCVSVAVRKAGKTIIGVVHEPHTNETYVAQLDGGAEVVKDGKARRCLCPDKIPSDFSFSVGSFRVAGSTEKKAKVIADIKKLGGREREWGCVALSICAVARGGLGIFVQGNSKVHDHVAALIIAGEAGASIEVIESQHVSTVDVIVAHPSLHESAVNIFRTRSGGGQ